MPIKKKLDKLELLIEYSLVYILYRNICIIHGIW